MKKIIKFNMLGYKTFILLTSHKMHVMIKDELIIVLENAA